MCKICTELARRNYRVVIDKHKEKRHLHLILWPICCRSQENMLNPQNSRIFSFEFYFFHAMEMIAHAK